MPREGITAYDLLISCPSDVNQFVNIIKECVDSFNKLYGEINNVQIVPRHWSTDSYSQSGKKPQELLNKQFVSKCDAAVAIFWTKFGTPTTKYGSGTEEEIEEMLSLDKQVFMYFLDVKTNPSDIDPEQYKKVQDFKEKYKDKGLYSMVKSEDDLKRKFTNDLGMYFLSIVTGGKKDKDEKNINPILKITSTEENQDAVVEYYNFLESEFLVEKRKGIILQIKSLQNRYLKARDRESTKSINSLLLNEQNLKALKALSGEIKNADIDDICKNTICKFANENNINIDEDFWNVGNLKKRISNSSFVSILGGDSISFEGTKEEKERYTAIEELYIEIISYYEFLSFFEKIDKQGMVYLSIANIGKTFDEDIDIKLYIKKKHICKLEDIPIPGNNIVKELLDSNFIRIYQIESNDTLVQYTDYPILSYIPSIGLSTQEDNNKKKEQYIEELKQTFCYEYYEREDVDVLKFHIKYLKHNTIMAFPSVLLLKKIPDSIEYEISSKHVEDIVKGTIKIQK